ncbi:MAG: TylF/MycF family methyltransferase [Saprospiraceae bacterium]|nr:TylF/MycF family methyltransferase [Saprospiraceae bacterium]
MGFLNILKNKLTARKDYIEARKIYNEFRDFTMISSGIYMENLMLAKKIKLIPGAIVECGVWRGGMSAGIATILGNEREYFLYDSFEGLPEAKEIDGANAIDWQNNKTSSSYYDNCSAEIDFAEKAMAIANVKNVHIIKGWFNETLPKFPEQKIALLRLDGDWYESTMDCLNSLFDHVVEGGYIIFDDYYSWDGCTKALHDFLSSRKSATRIRQFNDSICYLIKNY